ncbi:MAG: hypothetical protein JWO67_6491 [Streptosporangiaceae bacterium]|nr:hypothetical protein [Streptosporangiaceae bacterium]
MMASDDYAYLTPFPLRELTSEDVTPSRTGFGNNTPDGAEHLAGSKYSAGVAGQIAYGGTPEEAMRNAERKAREAARSIEENHRAGFMLGLHDAQHQVITNRDQLHRERPRAAPLGSSKPEVIVTKSERRPETLGIKLGAWLGHVLAVAAVLFGVTFGGIELVRVWMSLSWMQILCIALGAAAVIVGSVLYAGRHS